MAVICVLSSCEDNLKAVQKMSLTSNEPIGQVTKLLLKHTDSGYMKIQIGGDKMLDFSNDTYPYTEFPEGIQVKVFERKNDSVYTTNITADYGILFDESQLVDLRGNVLIINPDGHSFSGDQLYWDQQGQWIFTDQDFTLNIDGATKTGSKLDANEDLTKMQARDSNTKYLPKSDL